MKTYAVIGTSAILMIAGAVSAQAASTPAIPAGAVEQNSQAMEAVDQAAAQPMNIRQQIQSQLSKTGYTEVSVTPASFLVHAKDKQGNPVEMVIGPDSFTEVTEVAVKPATAPGATTPASPKAPDATTATPPAPKP